MNKFETHCNGTAPTLHSDQRGFFQELLRVNDDEDIKQISWFSIEPGQIRGGHFHHTFAEIFIVLEGEVTYLESHSRHSNGEPEWDGRSLRQGALARSVPWLPHAFFSTVGAKVLVLADRHFNCNDPDTYTSPALMESLKNVARSLT